MLENIIKFKASPKYVDTHQKYLPIPAKLNIPEWYKKLNHDVDIKSVKGCIPFLDSLTSGYILKMPMDYYIEHNILVEGERQTRMVAGNEIYRHSNLPNEVNLNFGQPEFHPTLQLKGCPMVEKNKKLSFHKILNPWIIETPPGYSTMFLPPLNNSDDRFSIIPGIVDTDTFKEEVNFPIVVNGDKYHTLQTTIEIGTPYVQVIPFKREPWKMKIERMSEKERNKNRAFSIQYLINNYKKKYWHKKTWK